VVDLHLDGTPHDPDVIGPQLDADDTNDALTMREYVFIGQFSVVWLHLTNTAACSHSDSDQLWSAVRLKTFGEYWSIQPTCQAGRLVHRKCANYLKGSFWGI